jgi:hypothetical protein
LEAFFVLVLDVPLAFFEDEDEDEDEARTIFRRRRVRRESLPDVIQREGLAHLVAVYERLSVQTITSSVDQLGNLLFEIRDVGGDDNNIAARLFESGRLVGW